jgi:hypothetical protein
MRGGGRWLAMQAVALLSAAPSFSQTTGRVEGRVVDSTGGVLPGVTLTIGGPSLQGLRTTTTDHEGRFRFLALPTGAYKVTGSRGGFATVELVDVRVPLDGAVTLDLSLGPVSISETVTVTDVASIDASGTTSGARFESRLIDRIPVARNYQALALLAPGVTSGGLENSKPSMGGAIASTDPSVRGATGAENRYLIDGLDTTDPAFGVSGVFLPMEFVEELDVKTGGYQAEYGGALGGILNVVTKSGSNALKGEVYAYYSDDNLRSTPPPTETVGQDLGIQRQYDFGGDIGGKLVRDQLWYFAALNRISTDQGWESYTRNRHVEERRNVLFSGKLSWQANPRHSIVASIFGDPGHADNGRARVLGVEATAGLILASDDTSTHNYSLVYNGILGPNALLKLSGGHTDQDWRSQPGADTPMYVDLTTDARWVRRFASDCGDLSTPRAGIQFSLGCLGGGVVVDAGDRSRSEVQGSFSWFTSTGSVKHELKLGASSRWVQYRNVGHFPAPIGGPLRDETGALVVEDGVAGQRYQLRPDNYRIVDSDQDATGNTHEGTLFVQDQMRIGKHAILDLGLRFDSSRSTGPLSAEAADREMDFGLGDMIAPRIGLVVDPAGTGRSKLFAYYGRFYESVPLDINVRKFGRDRLVVYDLYYPSDGSLPSAHNLGTLYGVLLVGTGVGTKVQHGLEAMYSDEYMAGVEYGIGRSVSIGLKGVYRRLGQVVEDISVDGARTLFIANVGRETTYRTNPVTGQSLAEPVTFPSAEREYKGLEVTVAKAFTHDWQWNASYVLSWNEGNYGGLFRQDTGQLQPNNTTAFDVPSLLKGASGPLPNDRRHQVKAYGTHRFPIGITLGAFAEYLTGTPISKLGGSAVYGRRERFIGNRGEFGRTPSLWHIDLHLEYPLKLSDRSELRFIADAFNVTDQSAAVSVDQEWTLLMLLETADVNECGGTQPDCARANTTYGLPTAFQDPRALRVGMKLSWK